MQKNHALKAVLAAVVVVFAVMVIYALNRPAATSVDPVSVAAYEAERDAERAEREAARDAEFEAARLANQLKVERPTDGPLRVLFAGDSLTSGFYASTEDKSFKHLVAGAWGDVELTSASLAGETVSMVSSVIEVPADLDIAVIELGTNDVGEDTPLPAFRDQYTALIEKVRASSPNAALICAGTWTERGTSYDNAIKSVCEEMGGRYAPLSGLYRNPALHGPKGVETWRGMSDVFHPNDAGHAAIAEKLLDLVAIG